MGPNTQMWWTLGSNKSAWNLGYSVEIHLQRLGFECRQSWTSRLGASGLYFTTADPRDVNRNLSGTDTTPGRWLLLAAENSGHLPGSLPSLVHRDGNTECLGPQGELIKEPMQIHWSHTNTQVLPGSSHQTPGRLLRLQSFLTFPPQ